METLILTNGESACEIALIHMDDDAYVSVSVDSRGFKGHVDLNVWREDFRRFCTFLLKAQRSLRDSCELCSISPGELDLKIRPSGALGLYEVVGTLGNHILGSSGPYWHSVSFGFQIEPGQLDRVRSVSWVLEYGKE